jgi:hypothetical protein
MVGFDLSDYPSMKLVTGNLIAGTRQSASYFEARKIY